MEYLINKKNYNKIRQNKFQKEIKMYTENQQQICTNCNKEFPSDKIDLHEAYCCRNIRRCQQCNAMVDIKDMDEHNKQLHTKKPCTLCSQQFQPSQLSKHQSLCPRRPVLCQYCENKYAHFQFARHQQMCGARTKPCSQCQRLVTLKDLIVHQSRCNRRNQQRRQQRNQVSQDPYVPRQRNQAQRQDRQRQNSTNNLRQPANRGNSIQNNVLTKPTKIKPLNMIGPETIKPSLDPIPISIRLALKQKQQRVPLKNKN